ncbi:MAG: hypothetical protein PHR82_09000 [Endomicrobiaceae bacterium]|nr:hypothetical protein [Endomicrobiaceae bacterium]
MNKNYSINLYYGYQEGECGIYHAFEATDPLENCDDNKIEDLLSEMLDTTPDDVNFNCDSMCIRIPDSLVKRIQEDAITAMRNN